MLDTPREALTTAALLRLPTSVPREDKMERVKELLEVLVRSALLCALPAPPCAALCTVACTCGQPALPPAALDCCALPAPGPHAGSGGVRRPDDWGQHPGRTGAQRRPAAPRHQ